MRVIIAGLGVQGTKRRAVAGNDCVYTVDPYNGDADFPSITNVPLDDYDAVLVCAPDGEKESLLRYLLTAGKHVLVEKPMIFDDPETLMQLKETAQANNVVCYTAYNHRFEPHFIRMKDCLDSGSLGQIYSARLFYGNGTARLVRDSAWRDSGNGVLNDLGSHLLDTVQYWLGCPQGKFTLSACRRFENKAPDHVTFFSNENRLIQLEVSLLSWRNEFTADIYGEKGSVHISSLCKWGPSTFTERTRILPSGRPDEVTDTVAEADPTWEAEYAYFQELCKDPSAVKYGNLENDVWIQSVLMDLTDQIGNPEE